MKNTIILIAALFFSAQIIAQKSVDDEIENLFNSAEYQTIVDKYGKKTDSISAKSLYNIGTAYMITNHDLLCIKYMDLSILKDSLDPAPYFVKARSLGSLGQYEQTVPLFLKCAELETDSIKISSTLYSLGYTYLQLGKPNEALDVYEKSIVFNKKDAGAYMMASQTYSDLHRDDKALDVYYKAKQNVSKDDSEYTSIIFNIGLFEQLNENYEKAESAFEELLNIDANDYHACAKLIQIYNHKKEYEKVLPLKQRLYQAHTDSVLPGHMEDMFCIDQFKFKEKQIRVFERYQEGASDKIYNKILFYILDKEDNYEYRIQTEYSPIAVAMGAGTYMLCASLEDQHVNYGIGFTENASYDSIKKAVVSVLKKNEK